MGLAADGTTVQVQIEEAGRIVATSPAAVPVDGGGRAVIDLAFPAGYPRHSRVLVRATARRAGRIVGLSAVEKTLSEKCLVTTIHLFPEPEPIDAAVSPDGRSTDAPASEDTTSRGDAGPDDANPGDDGSLSPVDVRDAHGPDGAIDAEVGREADATAGEDALDPHAT